MPTGPSARRVASSSGRTCRRSSSVTSTLGFTSFASSIRRSKRLRNSRDVNSRRTSSTSHSPITASSGTMSRGKSVTIRARSLLSVSRSPAASMFSFSFPFSSPVRASSSSTDPNSWTSLAAVLSPTPGTPGMLSDVSPLRATNSRYFEGGRPNRSWTAASSNSTMSEMPRRLNKTRTPGRTSWKKSRSAVTMVASIPSSAARRARVPIASSASWSATRSIGIRSDPTTSWIRPS